jgi:type IV pilus assembly protein PilE
MKSSLHTRRRQRGVTLIELMIVVVIAAILASIAIPSYRSYVLRTHRTEARTALMALAAGQEKFYVQNNRYADTAELEDAPPGGLGLPDTTENGWYTIAIVDGDAEGYSATATATGGQSEDTHCASFSIDQAGVKDATNDDCWD